MSKHFTTCGDISGLKVTSCCKMLSYYIVEQTFTTTSYIWSNVISCCKSLLHYIVRQYFTTTGDIGRIAQK